MSGPNSINDGICCLARGILLLAIVVPLGCSTAGARFDTSKVSRIVKGRTTKDDLRGYFGKPLRTEESPNGEVWTYAYVETHTTTAGAIGHVAIGVDQSETVADKLIIVFNGDVVKDYSFDGSSHTDTYVP
jgi:outer membrane protein assembly factor BamE (lipoprotein component of BamABCDE complex)